MEFSVFQKPRIKKPFSFSSSAEVYQKMKGYQKADREIFVLLFLNSKNVVTNIETHSIGSIDCSAVYPQQIFRSALINNASSIICVHNHPSGDPDPSVSDREITKQIAIGSHLIGIRLLDHVVLGDGRYFSFADDGLIEDYEKESEKRFKF
ncbi:MAG: DNA repair protein RadC [Candidatus Aminicenantes bacterium]|nr:DNA repair protein RadC [Candidatus Aminicenantes bacterium]